MSGGIPLHDRVLALEKRVIELIQLTYHLKPLKRIVYVNLDHGVVLHKSAEVAAAYADAIGIRDYRAIAVPVEIEE